MTYLNLFLYSPRFLICLLSFVIFMPHALKTQAEVQYFEDITIGGGSGFMQFDSSRHLKSQGFVSTWLGYQPDHSPWGLRFSYLFSQPNRTEASLPNIDNFQDKRFEVLYSFKSKDNQWQPFATLGIGHNQFKIQSKHKRESTASVGLGTQYKITDNFRLEPFAKAFKSIDHSHLDSQIGLNLSYRFGQSNHQKLSTLADIHLDEDKDGVQNGSDLCPEPSDFETMDFEGCPKDSDKDGIPDDVDLCPDSFPKSEVNSNGCYFVTETEVSKILFVQFSSGSNKVPVKFMDHLKDIAKFMTIFPETKLRLEGFTDSIGSEKSNLKLSLQRAQNVAFLLTNYFEIDPERITHDGYGELYAIGDNGTEKGRKQNRRVVSVLTATIKNKKQRVFANTYFKEE